VRLRPPGQAKPIPAIVLLLAFGLLPGQAIAGKTAKAPIDPRKVFDIDLPHGCVLTSEPGPDFQVFFAECKGENYAGVYLGDTPDMSIPHSRILKTGLDYPEQMQVWSTNVPANQELADKIAASVRLRVRK